MGKRYFSDKIAEWYLRNKRPLPWRDTTDPYHIWLSEIILQQTRVSQGLPYYLRFVETFPSVRNLAAAEEQKVLRLWQGLGYYTRARNLHKCARAVVELHNGVFPTVYSKLLSLPGIGQYTAAAIASFSSGERVAVVDGNVFRVLSRVFGVETPINSPEGKQTFGTLANELLCPDDPARHNQAIMEFGALHCTPKKPGCESCPLADNCVALKNELIDSLPVKIRPRTPRQRYFFYFVLEREDAAVLMKKRQAGDIWHGLYDFILVEKTRPVKADDLLAENSQWLQHSDNVAVSKSYKHILTHQTIHCRFIKVKTSGALPTVNEDTAFYSPQEIAELPKPALISRFLEEENRF